MSNPVDSNPWLDIPLADYEGHMTAPHVGQLSLLSELFAAVLSERRPASVAILGVAGGNGLEHIDPTVTQRICGIDIHADYLEMTRQRFGHLHCLELLRADLSRESLTLPPFQLVHAALVFEHAGMDKCLDNAVALVAPGGALSVVLQLPSDQQAAVAQTAFPSLQTLAGTFAMIDPAALTARLAPKGLDLEQSSYHALPGGKRFWMGMFVSKSVK